MVSASLCSFTLLARARVVTLGMNLDVQAIRVQMNKMLNMPEEMATMIKQLDILIEEMAGQLKNVESMRSRTDWLPDKHKDDKSVEHAEQSRHAGKPPGAVRRGILSKFF